MIFTIVTLITIGESALDILNGALEIGVGAVFTAIGAIMEVLGIFRSLTAEERTEAQRVFGNTLPYDDIQIHIGSWLADLSSWGSSPNAITTMRVVHFPSGTVLQQAPAGARLQGPRAWSA